MGHNSANIISAKKPVYLNIIWHMHQPTYKDAISKKYAMPWVRLHAIKDYYEMAKHVENHPNIKITFNYVPSLLEQINDYVKNDPKDLYNELTLKDPKQLTQDEKTFIEDNFLILSKMTQSCPRYMEIYAKVEHKMPLDHRDYFDLQTLFNLVWFPPSIRKEDAQIEALFQKGRNFNQYDKRLVLSKQIHYMSQIIPKLKALQKEGIIEMTTSPFYHPILPLLYNNGIAELNIPGLITPGPIFNFPEDVNHQINSAVNYHKKLFGKAPAGMWPSEGSISDDLVPFIEEAGLSWIASGQENLVNSLCFSRNRPKWSLAGYELFSPWQAKYKGHKTHIVFRDDGLSNLIGFDYKNWNASDAVEDLFKHFGNIKADLERNPGTLGERPGIISIILDGENAWEYYPNNAWDFFETLYGRLEKDDLVKTTTVTRYLNENGCPKNNTLTTLSPGSWIRGNFDTWIGSQAANNAWGYLTKVRKIMEHYSASKYFAGSKWKSKIREAWECVYKAEGSDSFWWYGGKNFTQQYDLFDSLFRNNLIKAYTLLGIEPPSYLLRPIINDGQGYNNFGNGLMQK